MRVLAWKPLRLAGRGFSLATCALLFLICYGALFMWARSTRRIDAVYYIPGAHYSFASGGGGIFLDRREFFLRTGQWSSAGRGRPVLGPAVEAPGDYKTFRRDWVRQGVRVWQYSVQPYNQADFVRRSGGPDFNRLFPRLDPVEMRAGEIFNNTSYTYQQGLLRGHRAWVPYWLIAFLAGILPLRQFLLWRRRRRRARMNLCLRCGFDLRASPERCPECGTPITSTISPRGRSSRPTPPADRAPSGTSV